MEIWVSFDPLSDQWRGATANLPLSVLGIYNPIAPVTAANIFNFGLTAVGTPPAYSTSSQVTGKVYSPEDADSPSPAGVNAMISAFNSGSAQAPYDRFNFNNGVLDGQTFQPGMSVDF